MGSGTLYFFCGKMGAGKTTASKKLADAENAVLISEDEWLSTLYPDLIDTFNDYLCYSSILKPLVFEHVKNLLRTGSNVVLDFPANTTRQRKWFVELANAAEAPRKLIYIKASDATCLQHISRRRMEQPKRAKFDTEAVFNEVTRHFQEPEEFTGADIEIVESKAEWAV